MSKPQKRKVIVGNSDSTGTLFTERSQSAEVSAAFHEDLFARCQGYSEMPSAERIGWNPLAPFTLDELLGALRKIKTGKATDSSGTVGDMIQRGGPAL